MDGAPRGPRGPGLDTLPAVAIVVPSALIQVAATVPAAHFQGASDRINALTIFLLLLGPALLLLRRRFPVATLLSVAAVTATYLLLDFPYGPVFLSVVVALFNAVLHGRRLAAWIAGPSCVAALMVVMVLTDSGYTIGLSEVAFAVAWLTLIMVVAEIVKARKDRATQAEATREEQAKRRAGEERLRIAREVHDVLAHHVSLINVQSGVALHLIDEQPEQVRQALVAIKQSSKEVLVELRNILGVLRDVDGSDGSAPRHPVASLEQLDSLLERMRSAGLPVRLTVAGERRQVPSGVDAAALRIVQESLTNTYRHAGPAEADVRLEYLPDELRVQVDDSGRGHANGSARLGSGSGLTGMRQRAEALGGALDAGPRPGGGFRVSATLPTGPADQPAEPVGHPDTQPHGENGTP
ncbi:MAG TPA: sensor histidine kinase [Actinophytocola sp.]|jgi:signal transduction histidine kinase|nr:sensor histidine kinase [Actinophytocola sp.]